FYNHRSRRGPGCRFGAKWACRKNNCSRVSKNDANQFGLIVDNLILGVAGQLKDDSSDIAILVLKQARANALDAGRRYLFLFESDSVLQVRKVDNETWGARQFKVSKPGRTGCRDSRLHGISSRRERDILNSVHSGSLFRTGYRTNGLNHER